MNFDSSNQTISNIDRVLDEIRLFVRQGFSADPILVRDVAAEYAEACAYTNQRLNKISRLLRQGLTSEAIQLAEQSPAIIPLARQLSFPDAEQWSSLLYQLNLEQPPAISLDVVQEFTAAQENYHRLQILLDQHRLLALARAPLSSRILVLRKIRRREPDNPAWKSDLMAWETQRLEQIPYELKIAAQKHDLGKLVELRLELKSSWLQEVPDELTQQSRRELANEKALRSKSTMAAAATQIAAARAAGDVESALEAQDQLRELGDQVRNATISTPQASSEDIQWLENQKQKARADRDFTAEVETIEKMIAFKAEPTGIQQRLQRLRAHDQPIPTTLLKRVEHYFAACKRERRYKLSLRIAAIGLGIAAIAVCVYGIFRIVANQREYNDLVKHIEERISSKEFDIARNLIETHSRFKDDQKIVKLRQKINENLKQIENFEDEYTKINNKVIARFEGISSNEIERLIEKAVTEEQRNRASMLAFDYQQHTKQKNPEVERCALAAKQLMLRLPENVKKLEEDRNILNDLISKSGPDFDGIPKLTSSQLDRAKEVLAFIDNGLTASKADAILGLDKFESALSQLEELPTSRAIAMDIERSKKEASFWTAYRDSQIIAEALAPEALAEMTVARLREHLEKLKEVDVVIGEESCADNLKKQMELKILGKQADFRSVRVQALKRVNRILSPHVGPSDENFELSRGRSSLGLSAPNASEDLGVGRKTLLDRLKKILSNDEPNDLATLEATYIKIIECLIEADESVLLSTRGQIVRELDNDFRPKSAAIVKAIPFTEDSADTDADNFINLRTKWPQVKPKILLEVLSSGQSALTENALTDWRAQFNYECIGWLYLVPQCDDGQRDRPSTTTFTIIGKQLNVSKVEIYCLLPRDGVCQMVPVGTLRGGIIGHNENSPEFQVGRPVYVEK